MKYFRVIPAEFIRRPNRFIAEVRINGKSEIVHVKNTGRCKELLIPGVKVWLSESENPLRKTRFDLIAVEKQRKNRPGLLINMDSQIPNSSVAEWLPQSCLFSSQAQIIPEVRFGSSRFDFQISDGEMITYLEVKGVTLEDSGIARFPDAPTERGVKHIRELISAKERGYGAIILFVIQMKEIREFQPNDQTHAAFGDILRQAEKKGVRLLAYDCRVTPDSLFPDSPVRINLQNVKNQCPVFREFRNQRDA